MPDPAQLRDSTQIVLASDALHELETRLDEKFTVTVVPETDGTCRVIGSPLEIKAASEFLARHGVHVR